LIDIKTRFETLHGNCKDYMKDPVNFIYFRQIAVMWLICGFMSLIILKIC
jgi:hypothetical protein